MFVHLIWKKNRYLKNGIEWSDCTVKEYIDFMKRNIIPSYYKEEYEKWKNDNNK